MNSKNRLVALVLSLVLVLGLFAGCGGKDTAQQEPVPTEPENVMEEITDEPVEEVDLNEIKVAAMKGPTGIGIANLMNASANNETKGKYDIQLEGAADLVASKIIKGEIDIAAVPVNLASVLYNKTEGNVELMAVNTLGVLSVVAKDTEISSVEDLRGKTIHTAGQGTTPEYVLNYILTANGLTPGVDVNIEFEVEANELQAKLLVGDFDIAVLPEPFVSGVLAKDEDFKIVLDLTEEWEKATDGAVQTTGGLIVRKDFLAENPEEVKVFLEEYAQSVNAANGNLDETAKLVVEYGIIGNEELAKAAIPRCNVTFLSGEALKTAATTYLEILFELNPQAVGGELPNEDFFYMD